MRSQIDIDKLRAEQRQLSEFLSRPDAFSDPEYADKTRRLSEISDIIEKHQSLSKLQQQLEENQQISAEGGELADLAREEIPELEQKIASIQTALDELLIPRDPNDDKNAIVEIRAGAGGDEASLFASELLRMYLRYAENHSLKTEILNENVNDAGGIKEVIFAVHGERPYGQLKFESGV
ncbi:MAG: PCRF domain-containing protein, partial [Candidatus Nomurabacteria bacterium]|nr:PCRF domain-containing protein [Candidatus Nomurabacteria bacterium]